MSTRKSSAALADDPARVPAPTSNPTIPLDVRLVPIHLVVQSPLNPRKHSASDESLRDLTASIAQHGVLQPIVVRAATPSVGQVWLFEVVAGSRRLRAAELAGKTEIPVTVRELSDAQVLELALAENVHRRDMSVLDEARALEQLQSLDPVYGDLAVLAVRIGRSVTYTRESLRLLRLSVPVQSALEAEAITASHAHRIARLPVDQHARALAACFRRGLVDAEVDGCLLTLEQTLERGMWDAVAPALGPLRDLEDWIACHGKADLEQLAAFAEPAQAEGDAQAEGEDDVEPAPLVQLSAWQDYGFTRKDARDAGVIHASDWAEVRRSKDRCAHTRRGAVVHPPGAEVRLVDVCTAKRKCAKHWPEHAGVTASGGTKAQRAAEERDRQEQREKTEAERKAWEADAPGLLLALGRLATRQPISIVQAVRAYCGADAVARTASRYGVAVTEKTAAPLMLLQSLNTYDRQFFLQDVKRRFGFSASQLTAEVSRGPASARAKTKTPKVKGRSARRR